MSAHRSGMVALAGRPNVGKSTLANALTGQHVAAVSPRPQTTRRRLAMAVHGGDWQAVLLDIPGFQTPRDQLTKRMQATVDETLSDCDAALVMVNASEAVGSGDRFIAERVRATLLAALAYFVMPFDFVPDLLALIGFSDDVAVIAAAIAMVRGSITPAHREAARKALADETNGESVSG